MPRTMPAVPALIAAAVLTLAGCGGGSAAGPAPTPSASPSPFAGQTAEQVLKSAQTAAENATSVHLKGGGGTKGDTLDLDLTIQYGKGVVPSAVGTIDIGDGPMEIRRVDDTMYLKAGAKFWKKNGNAQVAALFADKWLSGNVKKAFMKDFAEMTGKSFVTQALEPEDAAALERVAGIVIDGQQTVGLSDSEGTLYISTAANPLPLRVDSKGKETGQLVFDGWNKPLTVAEPRNATDFDALMES